MKFEIRDKDIVIGICSFERADPPMGFVHGELRPTKDYDSNSSYSNLKVIAASLNEIVGCESVIIEDLSQEMGELCIEITALLSSSEEFDKYFMHHRQNYESQFG